MPHKQTDTRPTHSLARPASASAPRSAVRWPLRKLLNSAIYMRDAIDLLAPGVA